MISKKSIILFSFILLFLAGHSAGQNNTNFSIVSDTFKISLQNKYYISSIAVLYGTEIVSLNGKALSKQEYSFSYNEGYLSLNEKMNAVPGETLVIRYQTYITGLKKEYKKRSLLIIKDESGNTQQKIAVKEKSASLSESVFGKGIQKSGSLIRGFEVSSNKDLTLNSGLRLQLSGRLSDDIEIVAALSDENIPIQPEGNTEKLNEIDKVFIEVKHKNAIGTFGDYELKVNSGEFSKFTKKLQGLKGEFFFGDFQGSVAVASSRGKFNSYTITGKDGNQGPYQLYGANNENDITIIAGSEKVFLDGIEMKRGENNDYIIEYSSAQITFTSKRVITSASRINIDYEYTDQKYERNFFGLNLAGKFLDDKLKIAFNYFRESDDPDNLIDYSLSEDEKTILQQAGNDQDKASVTGVSIAEADSLGNIQGSYIKADTTISGSAYVYYIYAPTSSKAIYDVVFSYVGAGEGDYSRVTLGQYKFVGIGGGSYMPIKYLPMPELKQNANLVIESAFSKNTNLSLELAGSLYNPNRFSLQDVTQKGLAGNFVFELKPIQINLFEKDFGKISFNFRERFLQSDYTSIDRINSVEFNRDYNVSSSVEGDQELREINLNYFPSEKITINSKYGMLKTGNDFESNRYVAGAKYNNPEGSSLEYSVDYVSADNLSYSSKWDKQNGKAYYTFGSIRPGIEFLYEEKREGNSGNDSLYSSSLIYVEAAPYIELVKIQGFEIRGQVSFRKESFPIAGVMQKQSDAFLRTVKIVFRPSSEISSALNLTLRNKNYTDAFIQKGYADNETFLLYSQNKFNFYNGALTGDLYYEAATEQTAKLQKVFVKVVKGTGNYKYLGDENENGVSDEDDFALTSYDGEYTLVTLPTDELYPVVDLKTSSRWNVDFSKILKGDNLISKIFKPVSSETSVRIEENSKTTSIKDIYLLNLSKFLNDSTTISGTNSFQQDLFLFKNEKDISFRFRFSEKRTLSQYSAGIEKGFANERSIRIRFQMVEEISNQTDYSIQNDNYYSASASSRIREINKNELSADFSYRPDNNIESGFKIKVGKSIDRYPSKPTELFFNSQVFRINFSFVGSGRLRVELERSEFVTGSSNTLPYELTNGNSIGKNYYWRFYFDYRLSANFTATVNYDGRALGENSVIHSLKAEAKAFF